MPLNLDEYKAVKQSEKAYQRAKYYYEMFLNNREQAIQAFDGDMAKYQAVLKDAEWQMTKKSVAMRVRKAFYEGRHEDALAILGVGKNK